MEMNNNIINDTIAAVSTPSGVGGIGIVRLSGPESLAVAGRIFQPNKKSRPQDWPSHTVHHGYIIDRRAAAREAVIDEVLLTVMRGPKSYTAEDIVEISCHGGLAVVRTVLNLALDNGARLARPGEFTQRAFLNGRIDLTQAEAVQDMIQATTESFVRASAHQLKGELTKQLESIRDQLMTAYAGLEAEVNFPDEGLETRGLEGLSTQIHAAQRQVEELLATSEKGRLIKDGVRMVICGTPNVGKSSLLNVLVQSPRAIVSTVPGTTRDTIEEMIQIDGIPFRLTDTAGVLEPRDIVEQDAVKRSRAAIDSADIVCFMLDAGRPVADEDRRLAGMVQGRDVLVVVNKCDLKKHPDVREVKGLFPDEEAVLISALKKTGIDQLTKRAFEKIWGNAKIEPDRLFLSNLRHIEALRRSLERIRAARHSLGQNLSFEFVCEDIRQAVNELDVITGRSAGRDVLDRIFSSFCIGK